MKKPIEITLFYADWCHFCKEFKPVWNNMKDESSYDLANIEFIEYGEQDAAKLNKRVNGYPTIRINIFGAEHEYENNRNPDDMYRFIIKQLKNRLKKNSY